MRLLDVGILAEVFSSFRCTECIGTLALYEEKWSHGWQSFFRVKCNTCDKELATFPSSRSLDIPNHHTCGNVPFSPRDMNEVTMRSVFDMPPPVQNMPSSYLNRLEVVTAAGVVTAMSDAAKQLHQRVDSEPSPEPKAINVTVSFDSSWKTRGFYSNTRFGAAIYTVTKKVLDYELLSRLCESKCSTETIQLEEKKKDRASEYERWFVPSPLPS